MTRWVETIQLDQTTWELPKISGVMLKEHKRQPEGAPPGQRGDALNMQTARYCKVFKHIKYIKIPKPNNGTTRYDTNSFWNWKIEGMN